MLTYISGYDFGYAWPWNYGHLILALIFGAAAWILRKRWNPWMAALLGVAAIWAFAGFLIVQLAFRFNLPQHLPTDAFLGDAAAQAKVLDVGCGSGRTTIMVALARPGVRVTGLDNFSADYIRTNGPDRLMRNVRAAGIDPARIEVVSADMRRMPIPDAAFDGVVSSYAIDHLNRAGIVESLHEVSRVLKPGGEFLLSNIAADGWLTAVYGPLLIHHLRAAQPGFWQNNLQQAGLVVIAEGRQPGSKWFLCRKPAAAAGFLPW